MDRWRSAAVFLAGVVVAVVAIVVGATALSASGLYDVSAAAPQLPIVNRFVHRTMIASVQRGAKNVTAAPAFTADDVAAGFCEYRRHCEMCHGGPAVGRPHWVHGMDPVPPLLVDARTRWNSRQLYWIVSNGIKMTAMPSWKGSMSEKQRWNTVAFLEALPQLPSPTYARWAEASPCKPEDTNLSIQLPARSHPAEPVPTTPTAPAKTPGG